MKHKTFGTRTVNRAIYDYLMEDDRFRRSRQTGRYSVPKTSVRSTEMGRPECCPVIDATALENFCSGVLIADRLVLTAGHSPADSCKVRIGATTVVNGTEILISGMPIRCDVSKVAKPRSEADLVDLALLVLDEPAAVRPALLATRGDYERAAAQVVHLCGFGYQRDNFGNLAEAGVKRSIQLPFNPDDTPQDPAFSRRHEFVAGGRTGKGVIFDAEEGDSGAPAYLETKGGGIIVIGIDSRNAAGHKSIYTRVDAHLDWIYSVAEKYGITIPGASSTAP
ncbi:MAG: trypsin-like serine protease [Bryobacteraceae bacterium]